MNLPEEGCNAIKTGIPASAIRRELTAGYEPERHGALLLDERGFITDCNKSFEALFGMEWKELVWQHVTQVFPQITADDFAHAGEIHPLHDYLIRCGQRYEAKNRHGDAFTSNLIFVHHEQEGKRLLRVMVFPSDDAESSRLE